MIEKMDEAFEGKEGSVESVAGVSQEIEDRDSVWVVREVV